MADAILVQKKCWLAPGIDQNLSFAKVLQQIHVRAYTKSHREKTETEKSRDLNGLTEVELTDQKNCATLIARLTENSATEWSWPKLRKLLSRTYKMAPAPMLTIIIILVLPSVRFWFWPRFRIQTFIFICRTWPRLKILKTAARLRRF